MSRLICPYCGNILATRKWYEYDVRFGNISGFSWLYKLFNFFTGIMFTEKWNRIIDGPCPCKPPLT